MSSAVKPEREYTVELSLGDARPSTRPSRAQIPELTSIRGIAAIWVVLLHYNNDIAALFPEPAAVRRFMESGWLGVDVFFALSGFVIAYNYADSLKVFRSATYREFLRARLARIYPVHVATLVALVPMIVVARKLGARFDSRVYTAPQFVQNLLLVHAWVPEFKLSWNYPSWSISVEWLLYLIFPILAIMIGRLRDKRHTVLAIALSTTATALLVPATINSPFHELIRGVPQFVTGCLIYRLRDQLRSFAWRSRSAVIWALGIAAIVATQLPGVGLSLFLLIVPLIIATLGIPSGRDRFLSSAPMMLLGEVSYSLYMTHMLVQKLVYGALPVAPWIGGSLVTRIGILLIYAALLAAATAVCYVLIERPARRALRRNRTAIV
jgi:peptidoglycan/LPS O-acetylase OafA/YrhL